MNNFDRFNPAQQEIIRESIDLAKSEINSLMYEDIVPESCDCFGELHDYIDANMLGGFCDVDTGLVRRIEAAFPLDANEDAVLGQAASDGLGAVQDAVNAWLVAGRVEVQS